MQQRCRLAGTFIWLISLAALAASCGSDNGADVLLVNGHIITMDAADVTAEAVAVRGDTIVAIGTNEEISALAGPHSEIVDLAGRSVTPGLIDTHNHFAWGALGERSSLDIEYPAVKSIADIREEVREAAARLGPGAWIIGSNWDAGKLAEQRDIEAADLDDVAPDNPVWLLHTSAHYGVANSRALELAGINRDTADPPGGVIGRDAVREPNGILTDQAMSLVTGVTPVTTTQDFVDAIRARVHMLNAAGITTIKDPEIDQRQWDAYKAVLQSGELTVRVVTLWRVPDTMSEARKLLSHIAPFTNREIAEPSPRLVSGGVKIYIDGSGTVRTAWMYDDWNIHLDTVDEGNTGLTYLPPELLLEQIRLFHDAGIHIGAHAIGDRAIDFVLDAYDRVLADKPIAGLRHSIIHCNLPTDHALDLMAKLQQQFDAAYPEVQPAFLWWIGDAYAGNFGARRSLRVLPLKTFADRGIKWAGSSDFDVSPYAPSIALWAAAARETMLGTYGVQPWGAAESVPLRESLQAYTVNAAHQVFLDDRIGTIETGKLADLVVWDRDPYAVPLDQLRDLRPHMTLMNGEVVYRAQANE